MQLLLCHNTIAVILFVLGLSLSPLADCSFIFGMARGSQLTTSIIVTTHWQQLMLDLWSHALHCCCCQPCITGLMIVLFAVAGSGLLLFTPSWLLPSLSPLANTASRASQHCCSQSCIAELLVLWFPLLSQ